jgi:hypothetical protein
VKKRCAVHVARIGEGKGSYKNLVGKPEEKRQLRRATSRWENNIKYILKK